MARILVADDREDIREMLRAMLSMAGYDVLVAPDGESALTLMRARPVDLIITDIFMPGKEGIETIIELRRDFPSVKIVAMSGGGQLGGLHYLDDAVKLGAVRSILKPFRVEEILAVVREALAS
ncbi:MAG: response regulator [Candidatus Rokuibacteriota bacterium]